MTGKSSNSFTEEKYESEGIFMPILVEMIVRFSSRLITAVFASTWRLDQFLERTLRTLAANTGFFSISKLLFRFSTKHCNHFNTLSSPKPKASVSNLLSDLVYLNGIVLGGKGMSGGILFGSTKSLS